MPESEMWSAQFPSSESQQIEEYRQRRGYNRSQAVRELVKEGLEAETENQKENTSETLLERLASRRTMSLSIVPLLLATLVLAAGLYTTSTFALGIILAVSTVLAVAAAVIVTTATLAQLALARPLRGLVGIGPKEETAA